MRLILTIFCSVFLAVAAPARAAVEYESETAPESQRKIYGRPHLSQASYPVIGLSEVRKIDKKKVFIYTLEGTDQVLARHHKIKGAKDLRPLSHRSPIVHGAHKTFTWGLPLIGTAVGIAHLVRNIQRLL